TDVDALQRRLETETGNLPETISERGRRREIPACYCNLCGPDLQSVAAFGQVTTDDVIAIHSAATYRVFMLGFLPGFAYMGRVDERIAAPRHANPRVAVPKASIGIAGRQTGVYPLAAPGGWQIIARTPLDPFDMRRSEPFLFAAGDDVRFVP